MTMNKPNNRLWSEGKTEDDCNDFDKETAVFNLLEDITCLKEERMEARIMLKVFKACVETGVYPTNNSPCSRKINDILET